jgi:hypothetical protein
VIKFSHILTHLPSVTIVFSYYNFNYGLRLSRHIGSRHFSPEEQKPIYRPVALKGLKKCSCQLPEFCGIIKTKHVGAMPKIVRINYRIVHLLVLHLFVTSL